MGITKKVLFVHDGPLSVTEDSQFYDIMLTNQVVKRYLLLGDHLKLLMRLNKITHSEAQKMSKLEISKNQVATVPNFKGILKMILNFNKVKTIVQDEVKSADIVIARLPSGTGSLAVKYAKKYNKPFISEITACNWDSFWNYNWKGKIIAPYYFVKQRLIMKKLPHLIYVTKEFLQKRYPSSGKSINCSNVEITWEGSAILSKRLQKLKHKELNLDKVVLCTVGAIDVPYKGQEDVIKAIPVLKSKGYNIEYRLIGQGSSKRLKSLAANLSISEEVKIVGSLSHEKVFNALDDVDIYIHPSKQEGLPRALVEALSRACPAAGSNVAGIPELLPADRIFRKGKIKEIVFIIEELINSDLSGEVKTNFETAMEYRSEVLHKRRYKFFIEFLRDNDLDVSDELIKLAE